MTGVQGEADAWRGWLDQWSRLGAADQAPAAERVITQWVHSRSRNMQVAMMRAVSPKYVPREWLLVDVYKAAIAGDRS